MSSWEFLLISANAAWTEHETFRQLVGLSSIEKSFKTVNPIHCAMMAVHPLSIHLQIIYSRWISNFIQWKRTSQFCNNKYFNYIQHNLFHNTYIDSTTHTQFIPQHIHSTTITPTGATPSSCWSHILLENTIIFLQYYKFLQLQ